MKKSNQKLIKKINNKNPEVRAPETMTGLAWKRFRRHPGAMIGAVILILLILSISFASLSPYDPERSDIKNSYQAPSLQHPFGTDGLGRDLLTRVLYGGRVSLTVGLMVVGITLVIGVPIGAIAGYFGGWIDNVLMRIIDAVLSLPSLLRL
jgi:peptide/nickel transport system permease protein